MLLLGDAVIEGKIIRVGNSAAITVSKKDLEKNRLKINQKIEFALVKKNQERILHELFGSARKTTKFEREEKDREL